MNAKHLKCLKWLLPLLLLVAFHQEVSAQTGTTHCDTVRFTWKAHTYGDGNKFDFSGTEGKKFIVDWGDSRQDTVTKNRYNGTFSHRYYYDTTYHVMLYGVDADARILGLSLYNKHLTSLDVSGCTSLENLSCSGNQLTSLDVSGCVSLTSIMDVDADTLRIHGESMETLIIKSFSDNSYYTIGVLDAAGCTSLRRITLVPETRGTIGILNLQGCAALQTISCNHGRVKVLDVSGCKSLETLENVRVDTLRIYGVSMKELDLGNERNSIKVLDASGCITLESLDCNYNGLNSLNLSGCTSLAYLSCDRNQLTSLDVSENTALTGLACDNNQLTSLDVSKNTALMSLACDNNQLTSLDVSKNTALMSLACDNNQLTSLDVSENTALTGLTCDNNQLTSLDVSKKSALMRLSCRGNQLMALDVSGCTLLKHLSGLTADTLKVHGVSMDTLNLSYGKIKMLDASGCTSLTYLYCNGNGLMSLDVDGCTMLINLSCANNQLSNLDVSGFTSLKSLDCQSNQLSSLDVSACVSLAILNCGSNYLLSNLDVSSCTALTSLNCNNSHKDNYYDDDESKGNLRSLDVSKNTLLKSLDCAGNQLRSIDVSKNKLLSSLNCGYNRIPFSVLYKAYSQNSNWEDFEVDDQSDSITVLINRPIDLSSERIIGQTLTTFKLTDAYGRDVASDFWTENRFLFQFHEPIGYRLRLDNKGIGSEVTFTWYISVVEEMPVRYFTVQVASNNAGWGTATITGNGTYEEGTEVTVTAKANEGYRFINWTRKDGSVFSTEAVHTFTVSENVELTANFEKLPEDVETFTVAVAANKAEWGRVSQTGDGRYEKDEEVTVTAKANEGYRFINWTRKDGSVFSTEAVHTFTVSENVELTANFEKLPETETFTVSLSSNNPSWGIVSLIGNGICERGEAITIIATPMMGCRFINWTKKDGSVFSTEAVHTFAVTENLELTANFKQNVANESHGNDDFYVYVQGHTIHLSAERGVVQVYNATGICVYSGHATAIPVKSSGLYIVRAGERAYKVIVR